MNSSEDLIKFLESDIDRKINIELNNDDSVNNVELSDSLRELEEFIGSTYSDIKASEFKKKLLEDITHSIHDINERTE